MVEAIDVFIIVGTNYHQNEKSKRKLSEQSTMFWGGMHVCVWYVYACCSLSPHHVTIELGTHSTQHAIKHSIFARLEITNFCKTYTVLLQFLALSFHCFHRLFVGGSSPRYTTGIQAFFRTLPQVLNSS